MNVFAIIICILNLKFKVQGFVNLFIIESHFLDICIMHVSRALYTCVTSVHSYLRGGWDTTGVDVIELNDQVIRCNSSHLTSFAVLVDVDGSEVCMSSIFVV